MGGNYTNKMDMYVTATVSLLIFVNRENLRPASETKPSGALRSGQVEKKKSHFLKASHIILALPCKEGFSIEVMF